MYSIFLFLLKDTGRRNNRIEPSLAPHCSRTVADLLVTWSYSPPFNDTMYTSDQFMNPGPAPRPPAERPKLNLPTDSASTANSFSQMSMSSPSTPGSANLSLFPNTSTPTLAHTKTNQSQNGVAVIKEGYVRSKEDKFLATWNHRYLILREFRLDFLKNETGKIVMSIPLNTVTGVSRSEDAKMAFEIVRLANPKDATSKTAMITREVATKSITCEVRSDDEIYDWIDKIYERCPGMGGVSNPTNFSHRVHVGFDPNTGAFVGLPPEWEKLLTASAITKEDYKKNPQAVIEVLEFYSDIKMREQNPQYYAGMASPPTGQQPKPYGNTSVGSSIAPPRPPPPPPAQRLDSGPSSSSTLVGSPSQSPQSKPDSDRALEHQQQAERVRQAADQERRRVEEEARRARDEQDRRDQEAYNASLPKTRVPLAKQELGGYGPSDPSMNDRYKPSRPAPPAPGSAARQQPPLTAQRPAPPAPTNPAANGYGGAARPPGPRPDDHQASPSSRYPPNDPWDQHKHAQGPPPAKLPAPVQPVKPLNIANKQGAGKPGIPDGIRQAEAALTKKPEQPRQKEVRMSHMTENEVMDRLRSVVSKDNPNDSYSKQRKIGQGASGSVYVARVKEHAISPVARELYRQYGPRCQVAIKQMDLRSQPRKELIVNEIIVMKDSQHANIVNFLDSFLQEQSSELWVVMEFMEGGALTDIIDNNPVIQEDQIATICSEVRNLIMESFWSLNVCLLFNRPAKDLLICTVRTSSTVISRVITFFLIVLVMSRLVSQFRAIC